MSGDLEFPRPLVCGGDEWLCRSQGFSAESPAGRIGLVAEVRFGSRVHRPDALIVRRGLLGRRRVLVSVSEVEPLLPRQELAVLRRAPATAEAGSGWQGCATIVSSSSTAAGGDVDGDG